MLLTTVVGLTETMLLSSTVGLVETMLLINGIGQNSLVQTYLITGLQGQRIKNNETKKQ